MKNRIKVILSNLNVLLVQSPIVSCFDARNKSVNVYAKGRFLSDVTQFIKEIRLQIDGFFLFILLLGYYV